MKLAIAFSVIALIWCAAVVIKIATLPRGEKYRFAQWDGGLLLRGTELGSGGKLGFLGFAVTIGAISAWLLTRWPAL